MKIEIPKMIIDTRQTGKKRQMILDICIFFLNMLIVGTITSSLSVLPSVIAIITSNEFIESMKFFEALEFEKGAELLSSLTFPWWITAVSLFLCISEISVSTVYCTAVERRGLHTMGLTRKHFFDEYSMGFLIGLVMFSAVVGLNLAFGGVSYSGISFSVSSLPIILTMLLGFIIQGAGEEFMLRGYFMVSLSRSNSMVSAIFWSSFIFATLHIANPGISLLSLVNLMLFGIFAAIYFIKRGNLWGICAIHSAWNFVQGNVFGLPVSGTDAENSVFGFTLTEGCKWINGGTFGLEGGLMSTVVLLVSIVLVLLLKNKDLGQPTEE